MRRTIFDVMDELFANDFKPAIGEAVGTLLLCAM